MPTRALERLASEAARRCARLDPGRRPRPAAGDRRGRRLRRARRSTGRGGAHREPSPAHGPAASGRRAPRRGACPPRRSPSSPSTGASPASTTRATRDRPSSRHGQRRRSSIRRAGSSSPTIVTRSRCSTRWRAVRWTQAGLLGPSRIIASGREWATGDRLVCRRNDYRLGVRNGTRGTVVEIDRATPRAARSHRRRRDACGCPSDYLGDVHHGYALTGHISQGATVERTYLLATPERGGAEWAYVAATRQRVDLAVFVVHHEPERLEAALARSWGRSDAKHLALDLVDAGGPGIGDGRCSQRPRCRDAREAARPHRGAACGARVRAARGGVGAQPGTDPARRATGGGDAR